MASLVIYVARTVAYEGRRDQVAAVASRVGLPPPDQVRGRLYHPLEGTPLELPAFCNKNRVAWRVSRQRGAGLAPLA